MTQHMEHTLINPKQISSIEVYINRVNREYLYTPETKRTFFSDIKAGFRYFSYCDDKIYSREDIEKKGFIVDKDNVVYFRPFIKIRTSAGDTHFKYFDTEKELKKFLKSDEMSDIDWWYVGNKF